MDYGKESLRIHKEVGGKIEIRGKLPVTNNEELAVAYTPGVAAVVEQVRDNPDMAGELIATKRMVAILTNGTAVLGLGKAGAVASLPVMEGKALLLREFAGVEAFPIAINESDPDRFVQVAVAIADTFGGINLEDIAAPECFEIEEKLRQSVDVPVFHDDQHGTAIVVLAGLMNALKVVGKKKESVRVVISGAGAAGIATARLLSKYGVSKITICDSRGVIYEGRDDLNSHKREMLKLAEERHEFWTMKEAVVGADVFIGVSAGGLLSVEDVGRMKEGAIVFAMANPIPEIMPEDAKAGGAFVVATGRSDYPNQLNNVLVFPGVFKGLLRSGKKAVTDSMKVAVAKALAGLVKEPRVDRIVPDPFDKMVADTVAGAVISSE